MKPIDKAMSLMDRLKDKESAIIVCNDLIGFWERIDTTYSKSKIYFYERVKQEIIKL
jgi:hypothetical protein